MEYILGEKNIAADALLSLWNNGKKQAMHDSAYTMETMLEPYNIE